MAIGVNTRIEDLQHVSMENTYFTIKPALQIMNELQVTSSSTLLLFSAFAVQLTKYLTHSPQSGDCEKHVLKLIERFWFSSHCRAIKS